MHSRSASLFCNSSILAACTSCIAANCSLTSSSSLAGPFAMFLPFSTLVSSSQMQQSLVECQEWVFVVKLRGASAGAGVLHRLSRVESDECGSVTQRIDTFFSTFAFLPSLVFLFFAGVPSATSFMCLLAFSKSKFVSFFLTTFLLQISRMLAGNILRPHFTLLWILFVDMSVPQLVKLRQLRLSLPRPNGPRHESLKGLQMWSHTICN